jgi:hypothetical protein
VQQGVFINGEHLGPDGQSELTVLCYSHLPIHIFEDNMIIFHHKVTSCSAWSQTRTLTLQRVKVVFPSLHSPLPHLQAMAGSVLIIHSEPKLRNQRVGIGSMYAPYKDSASVDRILRASPRRAVRRAATPYSPQ